MSSKIFSTVERRSDNPRICYAKNALPNDPLGRDVVLGCDHIGDKVKMLNFVKNRPLYSWSQERLNWGEMSKDFDDAKVICDPG